MNSSSSHRIRRAAVMTCAAGALSLLTQVAPAAALVFHEMGAWATLQECNSARVDLEGSGVTQPCYTRAGWWYFKFAQNY